MVRTLKLSRTSLHVYPRRAPFALGRATRAAGHRRAQARRCVNHMPGMLTRCCLLAAAIASFAAVHAGIAPQPTTGPAPPSSPVIVERFLASAGPPLASYRAFRTLQAETRGGRTRARLTAWTSLDPEHGFRYSVVDEEGSSTIRRQVLRAALEAEQLMIARDEGERAALTTTNYEFGAARDSVSGLLEVSIPPRRSDPMLLEGRVLLTASDGDLVAVEGILIKRPSFWTRQVELVRSTAASPASGCR